MSSKAFNMEMNVAKAIGILAIVAGHCRWDIFGGLFPSGSFHVPLFFFISGYFFKKEIIEVGNTIKNYFLYVTKQVCRWLSRFYAYHFFYGFMTLWIFLIFNKKYGGLPTFDYLVLQPIKGIAFTLDQPLWFIYQLVVSLVAFALIMTISKKLTKNDYAPLAVFLPMAIAAVLLSNPDFTPLRSWMRVLVKTLFTSFLIYSGYLYRNKLESKIKYDAKTLIVVCMIQMLLLTFFSPITMDLNRAMLHHNIAMFIAPFTGIYFVLFISKQLAPHVKPGSFIDKTGRNTFHIMANHLFVAFLVELAIFAIDGRSFDLLPDGILGGKLYKLAKYKYLYTFVALYLSTYSGEFFNYTGNKIKAAFAQIKERSAKQSGVI